MEDLRRLKADWAVATKFEKWRFITVILFLISLGVVAVWLLWFLWDDPTVITSEMRKVLLSYLCFLGITLLSRVRLKPKKIRELEKR